MRCPVKTLFNLISKHSVDIYPTQQKSSVTFCSWVISMGANNCNCVCFSVFELNRIDLCQFTSNLNFLHCLITYSLQSRESTYNPAHTAKSCHYLCFF